ncbi:hypothetical protein BT96DRAFT_915111 [Gymnopus androsaceus JB14]|uniref:Uncharacterized protein n=1 Tax=Gymnopus androsaceus JB14 TaxID=1447944 RepID=A0A6A4IC38_9AGAR|nr:hypothetical protein BT96DRAFT_915111 [Gymnopus androsaceus JB14]
MVLLLLLDVRPNASTYQSITRCRGDAVCSSQILASSSSPASNSATVPSPSSSCCTSSTYR